MDQIFNTRSLEKCLFNAWPALHSIEYNGWILRQSGGYTKRANSANPLNPQGDFVQTRSTVESFYQSHNQPSIFRVTPLAPDGCDEALKQAGYSLLDPTCVMTMAINGLEVPGQPISGLTIDAIANIDWCDGFAAANSIAPHMRNYHDRMIGSIALPTAFISLVEGDTTLGYGLAVIENNLVGLFDIVVINEARRRGLGRTLTYALLQWAQANGATGAYLQVTADNAPARALYEAIGFRETYPYHYRIAPNHNAAP